MSPGGLTRPQSAHERETTVLRVRAEAAEAGRDAAIADRSAGSLWRITGALLRDAMARAVRAEAGRVAERTRANALHDRFEAQLTTAEQAAGRAWRQAARMGWAPGPLVVLLHDVHCHVSQMARFSGLLPDLFLSWSSFITTSSRQCRLFRRPNAHGRPH